MFPYRLQFRAKYGIRPVAGNSHRIMQGVFHLVDAFFQCDPDAHDIAVGVVHNPHMALISFYGDMISGYMPLLGVGPRSQSHIRELGAELLIPLVKCYMRDVNTSLSQVMGDISECLTMPILQVKRISYHALRVSHSRIVRPSIIGELFAADGTSIFLHIFLVGPVFPGSAGVAAWAEHHVSNYVSSVYKSYAGC